MPRDVLFGNPEYCAVISTEGRDIFGNPEYAAPSVTPDGSKLAYLKPVDGVSTPGCAARPAATTAS